MKNQKIIFILLALTVGFIFSLHNLIPWWTARQQGIIYTPFNNGDENIYASQVVAVVQGQLFDGRNLSSLPFIGPFLLASFTWLFGSVETTFILADFFLPAIIFLLLFQLSWQFKVSRELALVGSLASLFGYQLLTKINPVAWFQPMFFNFNRLIPPQLTFIFLLLFLISLYRRSILAGFWAGLLAYVYFYHWSAELLILAIFVCSLKVRNYWLGYYWD